MRNQSLCRGLTLGLPIALAALGCTVLDPLNYLNPEFVNALGAGTTAASLPGDAPGLLVAVENKTDRWIQVQIAYRSTTQDVKSYVATVPPREKNQQMLVCPIDEITVGDVSNLNLSGARVYLADGIVDTTTLANQPFIAVDPFGVLLREGVNYDCGDGLAFTVQSSSATRTGYQTFAYIRRSQSP